MPLLGAKGLLTEVLLESSKCSNQPTLILCLDNKTQIQVTLEIKDFLGNLYPWISIFILKLDVQIHGFAAGSEQFKVIYLSMNSFGEHCHIDMWQTCYLVCPNLID